MASMAARATTSNRHCAQTVIYIITISELEIAAIIHLSDNGRSH
jgi:hypothetical protein